MSTRVANTAAQLLGQTLLTRNDTDVLLANRGLIQIITGSAVIQPLQLFGSDGGLSTIVLSLFSNVSGRASVLQFSDAFTYNLGVGSDGSGNFGIWMGRSPGVAGTQRFGVTAASTIIGATTGNKQLILGGTPATNAGSLIQLAGSNTVNNWQVSANAIVAGALEFTPSTTVGMVDFTTPVLVLHPNRGISIGGSTAPAIGSLIVASQALGTGNVNGPAITIGRNSSGGGAAGTLIFTGKGGALSYVWADASGTPGVLRISTAPPDEDGTPADTSGTVIGAQTSSLDTKELRGNDLTPPQALAVLLRTPVKRFIYKAGWYGATEFHGIITDYSPEFGMDPDEAHPNGRIFNPVSAFGYTVQAIKALADRLTAIGG